MSPFYCVKFKKHFQSRFKVSGMCHFWVRNDPFALNKFVLVQTIIITIIYLLALFNVQNFKKNSYCSRVMRTHHFWIQNGPFVPNDFFFGKIMNIIFIYLLAPFIVKNFYSRSRVMRMHHFLGHKWLICNNQNFFQKTC